MIHCALHSLLSLFLRLALLRYIIATAASVGTIEVIRYHFNVTQKYAKKC